MELKYPKETDNIGRRIATYCIFFKVEISEVDPDCLDSIICITKPDCIEYIDYLEKRVLNRNSYLMINLDKKKDLLCKENKFDELFCFGFCFFYVRKIKQAT